MAGSYASLFLARVGVGIGEAGGVAPAHSMLSDIFAMGRRATAMAIYATGTNLGVLGGFLLGGWLNEVFGWRTAFFVVGLPGVLLALWFRFTVAEPPREGSSKHAVSTDRVERSFKNDLAELASISSVRWIFVGSAVNGIATYGILNWLAPFFVRTYDIGTAQLGIWLALSLGLFGGIGTCLAGYLSDRLAKIDVRWYMWLPAVTVFAMTPAILFVLLTDRVTTALVATIVPGLLLTSYLGPSLATLHTLVDVRTRATASALYGFVINIIGLGCGPTLIGIVSDYLAPSFGPMSLKYALLYVIPVASILASVFFLMASQSLRRELER